MFDFLFEGPLALYIFFLLLLVLFLVLWRKTHDKRLVRAIIGAGSAIALLFLLDLVVETQREKAWRTVDEILDDLNGNRMGRVFDRFSDDFRAYGLDKATFRRMAEEELRGRRIKNFKAKSRNVIKYDRAAKTLTVEFNATAEIPNVEWAMSRCELDMAMDERGKWQITSLRLHKPVNSGEILHPFR